MIKDASKRIAATLAESAAVQRVASRTLGKPLLSAADWVESAIRGGRKVLLCGNGGLAAHAQHIAAEFVGRFEQERGGWPAIALTADTSILTALVNDYPPDQLFARQVQSLGQKGDVLLAFSASGNSPNILEAVKAARARGIATIGFAGKSGGKLAPLCDLALCAPSHRTARIQEVHLVLCHALCEVVEAALLQPSRKGGKLPSPKPPADPWPKRLALVVFDFDGVMTDNGVLVHEGRQEAVRCNRSDGWGIGLMRKARVPMMVLSTEENSVVAARCGKLKLACHQGVKDKGAYLEAYLKGERIPPAEVVYVGNDGNDLGCLERVGLPVVVADAHPSVLGVAKLVLSKPGGHAAVRELCDTVLARLDAKKLKLSRKAL
ncbi:MAG: SIS domain-containing protein [Planctomycetes bacterium]|nr:SIS domain-containing protein [Planctomycetota bacterium]